MPSETGEAEGDRGVGPRHARVVEDHADTRVLLARLLRMHGLRVTEAGTAAAAPGAIAGGGGGPGDVLVTDSGLPDGDGCDLIREFRAAHPGGLAVALTAHGHDHDRRCRAAGAHHLFRKPMGSDDLLRLFPRPG